MRMWMAPVVLLMLAGTSAAEARDGVADKSADQPAQCAAYLRTLEDSDAVLQIPRFFGSYQALRQDKVPARQPVDAASAACRGDQRFPDASSSDAASLRVMAAGRTQGTPWIVFVYPAERGMRKGYSAELVLYGDDGVPRRRFTVAQDLVDARYRDHLRSQLDENGLFYCAGTSYVTADGEETPPWEGGDDPEIHGSICEIVQSERVFSR